MSAQSSPTEHEENVMDRFFSKAGMLLSHVIEVRGEFPAKLVIARFMYERGTAEYDGRSWVYHLN